MNYFFHFFLISILLSTPMAQANSLKEINNQESIKDPAIRIIDQKSQESLLSSKKLYSIAAGVITVIGIVLWIIKKRNSKNNYNLPHFENDFNDDTIDLRETTD